MSGKKRVKTGNTRVVGFEPLITPREAIAEDPPGEMSLQTVMNGREELRTALAGKDDRLVVITGPCSIHNSECALDYANRLAELRRGIEDRMIIVMRTYFEKPRTTVGWKGIINDPGCDESFDMNRGLREARKLLHAITELGLPCATEFLDPVVPQYLADLVSWVAIGARTTESQTHRQMASGLSMPVGFKNSTDGSLKVAVDAMTAAGHGHAFLGIDSDGRTSIVRTQGNSDVHLVLRGGGGATNYSETHVESARTILKGATKNERAILIDCSHDNSEKDFRKQPNVFRDVLRQVTSGEKGILGMMLESFLVEGKQSLGDELVYGQSVTDGCINWEGTKELLLNSYERLGSG